MLEHWPVSEREVNLSDKTQVWYHESMPGKEGGDTRPTNCTEGSSLNSQESKRRIRFLCHSPVESLSSPFSSFHAAMSSAGTRPRNHCSVASVPRSKIFHLGTLNRLPVTSSLCSP